MWLTAAGGRIFLCFVCVFFSFPLKVSSLTGKMLLHAAKRVNVEENIHIFVIHPFL